MTHEQEKQFFGLLDRLRAEAREAFLPDDANNFVVEVSIDITPLELAILTHWLNSNAEELFGQLD